MSGRETRSSRDLTGFKSHFALVEHLANQQPGVSVEQNEPPLENLEPQVLFYL